MLRIALREYQGDGLRDRAFSVDRMVDESYLRAALAE
jgi:hypothetical protein